MKKIIKHYDKRAIEFALEYHDGEQVTWYFPTGSGYGTKFRYPSGDFITERKKHDSFDFELLCFNTFGHAHRELARSPGGLPWGWVEKEALKEAAASPSIEY